MKIKIDNKKEVTSRLPLEPFPEYNDLCIAHLTSVEVVEYESKPEANWEFKGLTFPTLRFNFSGFKPKATDKDRFWTMSFAPISNLLKDGTDREEAKLVTSYNQMFDKIKHLHDQYVGNENFAEFTTEFEFNPDKTIDERLAEFKTVFENVVKDFNIGKDKTNPIYKTKQNLAIVMIASGNNKTYLDTLDFVGKGIFDLFKVTDGKFDTYLKIPVNETVVLGAGAVNMATQGGGQATELPQALQDLANS